MSRHNLTLSLATSGVVPPRRSGASTSKSIPLSYSSNSPLIQMERQNRL